MDRAPRVTRILYLRRWCCSWEETGGLEKPDDGSVVTTGGVQGAAAGTPLRPPRQPMRPTQAPEQAAGSTAACR